MSWTEWLMSQPFYIRWPILVILTFVGLCVQLADWARRKLGELAA